MYQRAFEAVIWSMPAVAKYGLHRATFDMGAGNNVVLAWSAGAKPLFEALTPNNTTPYVNGTTDLRKGPVVLDVPPATARPASSGRSPTTGTSPSPTSAPSAWTRARAGRSC